MSPTFDALGVSDELTAALRASGIDAAFPIQELTIPDALSGRDICGKAKTGSGKTLAFGLPVLQRLTRAEPRRPTALVLVPTRELALQVHDELGPLAEALGFRSLAVYGGARMDRQINALKSGVELIIATPGRMIDLIERTEVSVAAVDKVVLDEADRMADMGFLPQVEWILRHIETPHQTLLFSATLDGAVSILVQRYQHDPIRHEVDSRSVTVDEMHHRFFKVHEMDKVRVAATIAESVERTLIFVRTKRGADRLTRELKSEGVRVAAIHGDLRQSERERGLSDFGSGHLNVLVATDVAARGIHVDDIDVVIHYDPAEDHKTYLHRSGRTARAGESGVAVTLALWDEELVVRRMQTRISMKAPIVEVFSNDPRLADLVAWDPSETEAVAAGG